MTAAHVEATIQRKWRRTGLVLARRRDGNGAHVIGDPCIVWDPDIGAWRMILFLDPPGHGTSVSNDPSGAPGSWSDPEPLAFTNPEALPTDGGTQKPFIVMRPDAPNQAARVDGRYWLVTVSFVGNARDKRVQRAWAPTLAGPWTLEPGNLIARGGPADFDGNHVDAVSGYWFEAQQQFVYFYMGYPLQPQPWTRSPYGNAVGVATQSLGQPAVKRGVLLAPAPAAGHWASGYLGGFQLLPGTEHRWIAVLNASPTPPDRLGNLTSEEPAPSLGGFAWTDAHMPLDGWTFADTPIERIEDIPDDAVAAGEGVNLWRQHILVTPTATRLFYNSGSYGQEQLYSKQLDGGLP